MLVEKRAGELVNFEEERILWAIINAMQDVNEVNRDKAIIISQDIVAQLEGEFEEHHTITVDEIQNRVEDTLIEYDLIKVAKQYIRYRYDRNNNRKNDKKYIFLSKEFLSKYKHKKPPMTDFGSFVYYRTYSRWIGDLIRRENWWETVARAVDYNCSLDDRMTVEEAERLYDNIFHLRQFLSGRTFWVGGTEVSKKYPMSNFNCAFQVIDEFEAYSDLFYLLMVGSGVGFRVFESDVEKLPQVRGDLRLVHKHYQPLQKYERKEYTSVDFIGNECIIHVGDSKEGWVQALTRFLEIFYKHDYRKIKKVMIEYNSVRPKGERLKTFGGTASGHESILNMFDKIYKVLVKDNNDFKKLKPIDCMDIGNIIGENVVVGGRI